MASSAAAARGRARAMPLAAVRSVPAWAWLIGIVVVSAGLRYAFARRMPAPWIVADELIYSELAKSFADSGSFEIRDVDVGRVFGVVYPILLSPAYALFERLPQAYEAAKAINAIVISLSAVPAYLLARRVLAPVPALVATALALTVPGMLYAGTIMTENAFYPLFLAAALALVLALEAPTPARCALLLGAVAVAFLTRPQAVLLLPAVATAPLLVHAFERRPLRALTRYAWLYGLLTAAAAAVLVVQAARGRSPLDVFGAYRPIVDADYEFRAILEWALWHVAELDLALGFLPFAALMLLLAVAPGLDARARTFLAAAASLTLWMVAGVAVFASRHALRIEERNLFYVQALFLIALVVWVDRGLPRPPLRTAAAVGVAALLPALLPFSTLIVSTVSAVSDTFGLLLWWDVHDWGVALDELWIAALLAGIVAALLAVVWPARFAYGLVAVVALYLAVSGQSVYERTRGASYGALFQGMEMHHRDWVDRAVGRDADVSVLYSGFLDRFSVVQNEFFSRSVRDVYTLGPELPGAVETPVAEDRETGLLRNLSGSTVPVEYVLVDQTVPLIGRLVERDARKGHHLLEVRGPLQVAYRVDGVYTDRWSGPTATYTRYACEGGTLDATMQSDAALFDRDQVVRAHVLGRVVARGRIPRVGRARIRVPLEPRAGRCEVTFEVRPTAVPGPLDLRRLGTHFRSFSYRP